MNEIKIDPNLGDWTPELVEHNAKTLSKEEFFDRYGMEKERACELSGIIKFIPHGEPDEVGQAEEEELKKFLQPVEVEVEDEPTEETAEESDFIQFDAENEEHLEDKKKLHWKQFAKKYGVKPNEL